MKIGSQGVLAGVALLLSAGCGGAQHSDPVPPPALENAEDPPPGAGEPAAPGAMDRAPSEPAATPDAKVKFDDMAPGEKLNLMKTVVAPEMAKLFQSVDPEKYKDFGCKTCHGPGVKDGNFDMPSAALPKLPENIGDVFKTSPDMSKFMAEQVVPKMASILGEEPHNPETHQGFGCLACHQKQQ
jgi:hypothetical protein